MADLTKPYHALVMDLNAIRPLDEQERRHDLAYGAFLVVTIVLIPLVCSPIAFGLERYALGIGIGAASVGLGLAVGLSTRRRIIRQFFAVRNAAEHLDVRPVTSFSQLNELIGEQPLAIAHPLDEGWLAFVYNWLRSREVLAGTDPVVCHHLKGSLLARYLGLSDGGDLDFLLIPHYELSLTPERRERIEREMPLVNAAWLADLVRAANGRRNGRANASAGLANKGQRLT